MLSGAPREAFEEFSDLLVRWNPRLNLLSAHDVPHVWDRHIEDALQLVSLIPPGTPSGIDLGSGAGFPGLILSIATGLPFDLIEADRRKAAFLREAVRVTGAPVTVHAARIEETDLPAALLVTARALAPLPRLLGLVASKLVPGGIAVLPKGAGYESELTAARAEWHMDVVPVPSRTMPGAAILQVSDLRRVPPAA